jgi:hypothetical protein
VSLGYMRQVAGYGSLGALTLSRDGPPLDAIPRPQLHCIVAWLPFLWHVRQ